MRINAVSVCLHYDDFLEQTARVNQPHFDDWTVVTTKEDTGTRSVIERYGLREALCPETYFTRCGSEFCKALAINIGLAHSGAKDCWTLHLDADIALPRNARKLLANLTLDTNSLYGCDRVECPSYEAWVDYLVQPDLTQKHYFARGHKDWKHGTRLLHFDYGGYVPIGYFQLWHTDSGVTRYPTQQNSNAEHTDMLHGLQWDREHRRLIPEFYVTHLATGPLTMGSNWNGRKTPRFGPSKAMTSQAVQAQEPGHRPPHHHPEPHPRPPHHHPEPYKP